jgi:hypothetical protein
MFRKRLDRAGFKGKILAGGIEVAWQEKWQRWLLHAHVLAIGVDASAWEQLEAALADSGTDDPVRAYELSNPDVQLSYCIKFVDYHRPGPKRVPLKPDRLIELAAWSSRHRLEDFLFVYGLPRRAVASTSTSPRYFAPLPIVRTSICHDGVVPTLGYRSDARVGCAVRISIAPGAVMSSAAKTACPAS